MTGQEQVTAGETGAGEIRSKLVTRLAVAGGLVALLLGVLAFFDHLATVPDESDSPVFTKPIPVAPKKEVSQPVTPAVDLAPPPVAEVPAEPPPPPKVEANTPPVIDEEPAAASENRPKHASGAAGQKPAAARQLTAHARSTALEPPPDAVVQKAPVAGEPATARLSPRVPEAKPASGPVVSRLFSGFLLQAGVFSSTQRAEELHARLTLSGVPSSLETRVQVGPFKTRQEAEAAQAKLKELGVDTILVPPRGKN